MAGVWYFGPGALQRASRTSWRSGDGVDLTSAAERIAAGGGTLHVRLADGWRKCAGNPLDLLELNQIALDRLEVSNRPVNSNGRDDGNRIEVSVQIHEDASVRASVIVGPSVIGAGASITHVGGRLVASVVGRDPESFETSHCRSPCGCGLVTEPRWRCAKCGATAQPIVTCWRLMTVTWRRRRRVTVSV
jgi:hypothetical protein